MKLLKRIGGFVYEYRGYSGLFLVYLAFMVILQSAFRIVFVLVYAYRLGDTDISTILLAHIVGLRFDVASGATLLMPFFLLSFVRPLNRFLIYRRFWSIGPLVIYGWLICHQTADLIYYENANKHLGYEGFAFFGDLALLIRSVFYYSPFVLIGSVVALAVVAVYLFYAYRTFVDVEEAPPRISWKVAIPRFLLLVAIGVVFMRGGTQERVLRPSAALVSQNDFVNNVALNPTFTMLVDLRSYSIPEAKRMDWDQAVWLTRREIDYDGARFISEEYPLLRRTIVENNPERPPNVVMIVMENWTGKFVRPIGDGLVNGKEVTPFFNEFNKQGLFFDHFMAAGGRTVNGLLSMLAGMPDKPGLTVFRSHHILNTFRPLPRILEEAGYETYFVTGGPLEFTNKKQILPHWGFQRMIGMKHMDNLGRYERDPEGWGYYDEDIYDVFHETLLNRTDRDRPFFAVFESLSSHFPYHVPDERFRIFGPKTLDFEFLNSYYYSDWALGEYMKLALESEYAENTIFIIVADHSHHRYLNYYEDRNIPLLIYWPGHIEPGVDSEIASQLDVVPTILGLLDIEADFTAMGKDLLDPTSRRSAYFAAGRIFGWVEGNTFYYQYTDATFGVGRMAEESLYTVPTCTNEGGHCDWLRTKGIAFLNVGTILIDEQRVYPIRQEEQARVLENSNNEMTAACPAFTLQDHYARLEARALDFEHIATLSSPPIGRIAAFTLPQDRNLEGIARLQSQVMEREARVQRAMNRLYEEPPEIPREFDIEYAPLVTREEGLHSIKIHPEERRADVATNAFMVVLNSGHLEAARERERLLRELMETKRADLPQDARDAIDNPPPIPPVRSHMNVMMTRWVLGSDCKWYPNLESPQGESDGSS